ncbi:MAG: 30S ribosomal protein S4 [Candidatus Omnitrophica bacterium]|nr:30S ribosomal protein S4 [Candidatus Omnitrophota bacterium]
MARYLDSQCKLCRREGMKLSLKGPRCNTEKCAFIKHPVPPGANASYRPAKQSYYAMQLREKQKTKRIYGMLEKQFRRFFSIANESKGVTGQRLLQLLELRLDNVIYRSLCALSRNQARQYVRHGKIFVNGKRVNIPSYIVSIGEEITVTGNDTFKKAIQENIEINSKDRSVSTWLELNKDLLSVKPVRLPKREDIGVAINEQFIVELYSK